MNFTDCYKKDRVFYQAKFDYYRNVNTWMVVACSIASIFYILSDWYIFNSIDFCTLPARFFVLIPLAAFIAVNKKITDYRIIVPFTYFLGHVVMWDTIWACYHLPDLTFASDGFIIICAIFLVLGLAAPIWYAIPLNGLLFVDIAIANTFLHYPEFGMMLLLGIPLYLGICAFLYFSEKSFLNHYITRNKLEQSVFIDQLTGVYNRKIVDTITNIDKTFIDFYGNDLSIMMLDIDFFKKVNDTYGHDNGDIVLNEVIDILKSNLRSSDYIIRWGGEEFVILMCSSLEMALAKAESIRKSVEEFDSEICPITVSIGLTKYEGANYIDEIKKADEALYIAKDSGRNRVVCK